MAYLINGQPVNIRKEYFRADGVRYTNLLDASVRAKLGVVETNDPDPFEPQAPDYDQRFYWGVNNPKLLNDREEVDENGNPMWVKVYDPETKSMVDSDKRLVTTGLKTQWIAQVKSTAGSMLSPTDWKVVRAAEGIKPVDADTLSLRASIRAYSDLLEASISGCNSVEDLIAVVSNQTWPDSKRI